MSRLRPENLSDFIDSRHAIYVYCRCCPHYTRLDVLALIGAHGDVTLSNAKKRLRCSACGGRGVQLSIVFDGYPESGKIGIDYRILCNKYVGIGSG